MTNRKEIRFNSMIEAVEYASKGVAVTATGGSHATGNNNWYRTSNWSAMEQLISHGYPKGNKKLFANVTELERNAVSTRTTYEKDVTGIMFDVSEVLEGTPECWFSPTVEEAKNTIKIYVDVCASASVTADQMFNRGAAIVSLLDKLCDQGDIVELYLVNVYDGSGSDCGYNEIRVNTQPVDIDELAFMFAHPSFFRRIMFGVMENLHDNIRITTRVRPLKSGVPEQCADGLYLGGTYSVSGAPQFSSLQSATEFVEKMYIDHIKKQKEVTA